MPQVIIRELQSVLKELVLDKVCLTVLYLWCLQAVWRRSEYNFHQLIEHFLDPSHDIYMFIVFSGCNFISSIVYFWVLQNGRRPLLQLLHPNSSRYFSPDDLATLSLSIPSLSLKVISLIYLFMVFCYLEVTTFVTFFIFHANRISQKLALLLKLRRFHLVTKNPRKTWQWMKLI